MPGLRRQAKGRIALGLWLAALLTFAAQVGFPQSSKKFKTLTNQQMLDMLDQVEAELKKYYFDSSMRGLDLDKRFEKARKEIAAAQSQDEGLLDIAGAVAALDDSHTLFIPPMRPYAVDYGWVAEAVGDSNCFVTAVRPGSDAAAKGIEPGDQIVAVNGITLTRQDIRYVQHSYAVFPQSGLHLDVRSPEGVRRSLIVTARVEPGQPVVRGIDVREYFRNYHSEDRSRYFVVDKRIMLWKLLDFLIDPGEVDGLLNKVRSYETLILDLRGNPGGSKAAAIKMIGGVFSRDVKIGDRQGRQSTKAEIAKSRGGGAFAGKVIVLIDSKSASAAEIFARTVQLEKRGTVLGDRSAGAVGEAQDYVHAVPLDAVNVAQYGTEITVANIVHSDGKSLERVGVVPDERILPTPSDLRLGLDPVLARAVELAGGKMTPEEAGKIFPFQWPKKLMPEYD